jgi:phage tail-like protein
MAATIPDTSNPTTGGMRTRGGTGEDTLGEHYFTVAISSGGSSKIGRFAECTGLAVSYDVMTYAEGGNNEFVHQLRGRVTYPNVTLKRGVTYEDGLLRWFYETHQPSQRPTLTIALLNQNGVTLRHFALAGALPVRWTGPNINAGSGSAATESLEIAHQGFV